MANIFNFSFLCIGITLILAGCGNTLDRIENVGKAPKMSQIENPIESRDYKPISMPMPTPKTARPGPNSLWQPSRRNFFEDQRADEVGDILTVLIDIDDEAEIENETSRERTNGEEAGLDRLLGYEASLGKILPQAISPGSLIDFDSDSNHSGSASTEREEEIELRLAAIVSQILPNGNLAIYGRQEVVVNFEKRLLSIQGIIRPEDINRDNTINYDKIAEARIHYGGEGILTDVQQPRYGQQIYDILFPF